MKEQFYNNVMLRLSSKIDDSVLETVMKEISCELDNYDLTKRIRDVVPYNYVPECAKIYIVSRKIEGVKMSSLQLYAFRINQFFQMVKTPIEKITVNDVRLWLYNLQDSFNLSDRTLDTARTIICTFFKWANAEGYIPNNPCANIKPIKYNRKQRQSLSEEELELFRNSCENIRDFAIVETLFSTGCRVSELINIKIDDVDLDRGEVLLFGKGEKYRTSYINARAKMYIKQYLNSRTDDSPYLFVPLKRTKHMRLSKSGVENLFRVLSKKSGINKKVCPHMIRHTTATIGLKRGMDITEIQKMLGHSSLDTTMIYAHVADEMVKTNHCKYIV